MLINLSNHPSDLWENKQRQAALSEYVTVVDLPFPHIDPTASADSVFSLAGEYVRRCEQIFKTSESQSSETNAVHVAGELTFCAAAVALFLRAGIRTVASASKRIVSVTSEGVKQTVFQFEQFREYKIE